MLWAIGMCCVCQYELTNELAPFVWLLKQIMATCLGSGIQGVCIECLAVARHRVSHSHGCNTYMAVTEVTIFDQLNLAVTS